MINHLEAAYMFDKAADRAMQFLRLHGFCYPLLYIINKGHPVVIDFEHTSILNCENDEEPENSLGIYRTVIGLKMENNADEEAVKGIAEEICRRHTPDGIGIVMSCMYNEYPATALPEKGSLSFDPEAIRVLHVCYWIKDSKNGYMQVIPYINRGEKKNLPPALLDAEDAVRYDINFMKASWELPREKVNAKLPDPYKRRTS